MRDWGIRSRPGFSTQNGRRVRSRPRTVRRLGYLRSTRRLLHGADSHSGQLVRLADALPDQLRPRRDLELPEHLVQVVLDRLRAEEELRGDVLVRLPLADQAGDLQLLRRQLVDRARISSTHCLAGRTQLGTRPLRPGLGTELLEAVDRGTQLLASIRTPALAAQELPVQKLRSRPVERPTALRMQA